VQTFRELEVGASRPKQKKQQRLIFKLIVLYSMHLFVYCLRFSIKVCSVDLLVVFCYCICAAIRQSAYGGRRRRRPYTRASAL